MQSSLPDCKTSSERLSNIVNPGIDDLSLNKTAKGSTWQVEMKSYKCGHDCEHKVEALERTLADAYVALLNAQKEAPKSSTEKQSPDGPKPPKL